MPLTRSDLRKKGIIYGDEAEKDQANGGQFSGTHVGNVVGNITLPDRSILHRAIDVPSGATNFPRTTTPANPSALVQGALARLEQPNPAPSPTGLPPLQPSRPALSSAPAPVAPPPPPKFMNDAVMDEIKNRPGLSPKMRSELIAKQIQTKWIQGGMTGKGISVPLPQTHQEFIQTDFGDQNPAILDALSNLRGGKALVDDIEKSKREMGDYMMRTGARVGVTAYETSDAGLKEYYDNMIANNPYVTPYNSSYAQELYVKFMPKNLQELMERDATWRREMAPKGAKPEDYTYNNGAYIMTPEAQERLKLETADKLDEAVRQKTLALNSQANAEATAKANTEKGIPQIAVRKTDGTWDVEAAPQTPEEMQAEVDAYNKAAEAVNAPTRQTLQHLNGKYSKAEIPAPPRGNERYMSRSPRAREVIDNNLDILDAASEDISVIPFADRIDKYGITGRTPQEQQADARRKADALRKRYYDTSETSTANPPPNPHIATLTDPNATPEEKRLAIEETARRWSTMAITPEDKAAAGEMIKELRTGPGSQPVGNEDVMSTISELKTLPQGEKQTLETTLRQAYDSAPKDVTDVNALADKGNLLLGLIAVATDPKKEAHYRDEYRAVQRRLSEMADPQITEAIKSKANEEAAKRFLIATRGLASGATFGLSNIGRKATERAVFGDVVAADTAEEKGLEFAMNMLGGALTAKGVAGALSGPKKKVLGETAKAIFAFNKSGAPQGMKVASNLLLRLTRAGMEEKTARNLIRGLEKQAGDAFVVNEDAVMKMVKKYGIDAIYKFAD